MNDIEKRARELLAAEFEKDGETIMAEHVRGDLLGHEWPTHAIRAIIAALTPPEGYWRALQDAARYRYIREIASGEPTAFGRIEDAAFAAHYGDPAQFDLNIDDQMAARPEVSP